MTYMMVPPEWLGLVTEPLDDDGASTRLLRLASEGQVPAGRRARLDPQGSRGFDADDRNAGADDVALP